MDKKTTKKASEKVTESVQSTEPLEEVVESEEQIPAEFYPFSNFLEKDVTLYWDSRAYTFPALSTTNLMGRIPNATPEQVQGVRKKFAYDLAQLAYFETEDYKQKQAAAPADKLQQGMMLTPPIYSDSILEPFVERCLQPLAIKSPKVEDKSSEHDITELLSKDEQGRPRSRVVKQGQELRPYED